MPTDQKPRGPPQMPAGASSLSERIAALQRKASSGSGSRPTTRDSSHHQMGRSLSGESSPSSSSFTLSSISNSGASPSQQSQAVRDRIAKFQASSNENGFVERPLVPRSSFGAPAPNPDISGDRLRVHRPYPGNMLRPQMTGGGMTTWDRRGQSGNGGLMPQLTGPTWAAGGRRQASTPESLRRGSEGLPVRQGSDAFAELDSSTASLRGMGLGSHAEDVASQAQARSGKRNSRSFTIADPALPILPDTPKDELSIPVGVKLDGGSAEEEAEKSTGSIIQSSADGDELEREILHLPSAPQDLPRASTPIDTAATGSSSGAADTSVEIEVSARSQEEMQAIRESARRQEEEQRRELQEGPRTNGTAEALPSIILESSNGNEATSPTLNDTPPSAPSTQDSTHQSLSAAQRVISAGREQANGLAAASSAPDTATSNTMAGPPRRSTIRRPPPGRVMSVAEMDASDDEYEPGWASVVSSSRGP